MSLLFGCPGAHAVVGADEVVADQHCVVPVGDAPDHLAIDLGPPVSALVVGAQRLGEAGRGQRQEGRGEGTRRPLVVQGISGLEVEGRGGHGRGGSFRNGRGGACPGLLGWAGIQARGGRRGMEEGRPCRHRR